MSTSKGVFSGLVAGFYAWISAVFFGGILVDILYSRFLAAVTLPAEASLGDFFLLVGFTTVLAAFGAIILCWGFPAVRNLFIASLVLLSFEFLIPLFFARLIPNVEGIGPWLRLIPSGLGSILALLGLFGLYGQRS